MESAHFPYHINLYSLPHYIAGSDAQNITLDYLYMYAFKDLLFVYGLCGTQKSIQTFEQV